MGIKQRSKSLSVKGSDLADSFYQLEVLSKGNGEVLDIIPFAKRIHDSGKTDGIRPAQLTTLQINVGKLCNQTCAHCHVDAGPDKKRENMSRENFEICLDIVRKHKIPIVDLTGGAPEMNPNFRWFVESCSELGTQVIVRCNLTIIMANKKYHDLPEFYKKHKVNVVSSLPYFSQSRTDAQRGDGVFEDSIKALKLLNAQGYGDPETGLQLDLVYNPSGAFLPGSQEELELEFKRQLSRKYDIIFNNLFAITNLPISRFLEYLLESGNYTSYMTALADAYNPSTVDGLMCRSTLSISWDGYIHDCDFNQMLELRSAGKSNHISEFDLEELMSRRIVLNNHCYGCTAGAGSSCGGEIS